MTNPPSRVQLDTFLKSIAQTMQAIATGSSQTWTWLAGLSAAYLQNGLGTITVATPGAGYHDTTTTVLVPSPQFGAIPQMQQAAITLVYSLSNVLLNNSGTGGYSANDILALAGGTGGQVKILTVDGSGNPLTYEVHAIGHGYLISTNNATTGSAGAGATFDVTGLSIYSAGYAGGNPGSGYGTNPFGSGFLTVVDSNMSPGTNAALTVVPANSDVNYNYTPTQATALLALSAADLPSVGNVIQGLSYVAHNGPVVAGTGVNFLANIGLWNPAGF